MAMLLPALKNAKDLAKKIVCAGNLKQIGAASLLYATDYNSSMPYTGCDMCGWAQNFDQLTDTWKYWEMAVPHAYSWAYVCRDGLKTWNVLQCPDDSMLRVLQDGSSGSYNGISYDMNNQTFPKAYAHASTGSAATGENRTAPIMLHEIRDPSQIVVFLDIRRGAWPGGDGNTYYGALYPAPEWQNTYDRHRMLANAVCVDGHVEAQKYRDWIQPWEWAWNPGNNQVKRFWYKWHP